MQYLDWQPGTSIASPVYLDANILVGTIVNSHPLYTACVQLSADILIGKTNIIISDISVDESLWSMAKLAYCEITNQRGKKPHWNPKIYEDWNERIFHSYADWIKAPSNMVKDWRNAGVSIDFVPIVGSDLENIISLVPNYMKDFKFTPGDAFHFAIAEKYAKTFVTADSHFGVINNKPPQGNLTIIHLTP